MSSLCGSLPFIDHVAQMQMNDVIETNVETEVESVVEVDVEPSGMESWKSQIQMVEKVMVWFKQGFLW